MSILLLQIVIKQWDKSQRTETHVLERAKIPDIYPIIFPPAFYGFNKKCIIDQHGDDRQGGRVKYSQLADRKIKIDRFQVCLDGKVLEYFGISEPGEVPRIIGSLNNKWIQCKYNWRYGVFESDMYYWLYEEVTLNTICISKLNEKVFLNAEPAIVYEDLNELYK
jgi:hypothetical protein